MIGMKRFFTLISSLLLMLLLASPTQVQAQGQVLGIHILHPYELSDAKQLVADPDKSDQWHYVTIPLSLDDLEKEAEWQQFFKAAKTKKVVPIVRLVSRFEDGAWIIPNRRQITSQFEFLAELDWPTPQKHIIVYNEVNHAAEWGGQLNPNSYAQVLSFTSQWAHSEADNYVVMPAAMDLAAPNGTRTLEAFNYLEKMLAYDSEVFDHIDVWNSHSYPNPGFSSSPQRTSKNSLRGFEHELSFIKEKTGRDLKVFITETGWVANRSTTPWLESYYEYALQHIWSDSRVVAVTPFLLRGDPGPFSQFAFLDRNNNPTRNYTALQNALKKVQGS
jgi:hypothetical protein